MLSTTFRDRICTTGIAALRFFSEQDLDHRLREQAQSDARRDDQQHEHAAHAHEPVPQLLAVGCKLNVPGEQRSLARGRWAFARQTGDLASDR